VEVVLAALHPPTPSSSITVAACHTAVVMYQHTAGTSLQQTWHAAYCRYVRQQLELVVELAAVSYDRCACATCDCSDVGMALPSVTLMPATEQSCKHHVQLLHVLYVVLYVVVAVRTVY